VKPRSPGRSGAGQIRPRYRTAHLAADLPCNVDHGIIGLMDPAHGPFVHQAWWWRSRASIREKTKRFEPIPEGFRMSAHAPSGNSAPYKLLGVYGQPIETTIDFTCPTAALRSSAAATSGSPRSPPSRRSPHQPAAST
jgi:phenylpropionate dioxygenase-like ring-hydroxylating dioxygenase large terminal subunit